MKTLIKKERKTDMTKCFYLSQNCELHIIPKTRDQENENLVKEAVDPVNL